MRKNSIFMFMLSGVLAWTAPLNDAIAQQQGGHQEHRRSHLDFKDTAVKTAWEHYVHLNEGLIATDATAARKGAAALEKSLKEVKGADKAAALAGKIAANDDLATQRQVFASLSNEMAAVINASGLASGEVYVAYCPMALKNQGASWLSYSKEIRNAYFGEKMLKCGMVKETIQ